MAAPRKGTRKRILDAAEKLFAENGYDGTSTRQIVAKSGDTIGSVNYHFGTKDNLLSEVIKRRLDEVITIRREAYQRACDASGGSPDIMAVVDSIVSPYLERAMCGGEGWRSYSLLQARSLYSKKRYFDTMQTYSEPLAQEFLGWMMKALPDADMRDLGYGYQFMIGSMVECCTEIEINRISRITDGVCDASDFSEVKDRLVQFISGGIRGILANSKISAG